MDILIIAGAVAAVFLVEHAFKLRYLAKRDACWAAEERVLAAHGFRYSADGQFVASDGRLLTRSDAIDELNRLHGPISQEEASRVGLRYEGSE